MAAKVLELEDSIREVYQHSKNNRKETGRLEGEFALWFGGPGPNEGFRWLPWFFSPLQVARRDAG